MRWNKSFRITIIAFVFVILVTSVILGFAFILITGKLGLHSSYRSVQISFLLNLLFISTIIGTTIATILSKKILKPLQNVIDGTKKVAKGDFTTRVYQKKSTDSDISQLIDSFNHMTEELAGIEMFRNDFINNFSHEFKTPISSIIGYAKELKRSDLSEKEKDEYLSIIISESERLSSLSSNILLLTKVENQKIISNKTTYYIDEQLRNAILMLQKSWEEKNIEWELDLDEIQFVGDEDLLSQAWINLMSNAIKFSRQDGKIHISCKKKSDDLIKIRISDEGIGMDDRTIEHAFDKFYQGDTSHATKGNGLGLPLVKKIVELSNGSISIRSRVGSGTIVSVFLPLEDV